MDNFYLFQYPIDNNNSNIILVVFCSGENISPSILKDKLREFFAFNIPPKNIFIIGGQYLRNDLINKFNESNNYSGIKDVIPNFLLQEKNDIQLLTFNIKGEIYDINNELFYDQNLISRVFSFGMQNIFIKRGGLIEAPSSMFHYVFPSGKHATRFIRTGNTLIESSEIFFIASYLLKFIKKEFHTIYCDTSSINSIGFALIEISKRFSSKFVSKPINSFGSYDKFENYAFTDSENALILISASTSGDLVRRLKEKNPELSNDNLIIIYYLSNDKEFSERVLCDLTYEKNNNLNGFKLENPFTEENCDYCKEGSYKVKINGDIFLLEKPKIRKVEIKVKSAPSWLSPFMRKYHSREGFNFIRCFYGEDNSRIFEIYFNISLLEKLQTNNEITENIYLREYFDKFIKLVNQYTPANLKYIIYLNDDASEYLSSKIKKLINNNSVIEIGANKLDTISNVIQNDDEHGSILVVSSCLVSGNNLLYVNKFLRRYKNLTKTYFVAFARATNKTTFNFVKNSIGQGNYNGINTNPLVVVEEICTSNLSDRNTYISDKLSWSRELELFKIFQTIIEDQEEFKDAKDYVNARVKVLEEASDKTNQGLVNNVFLDNPITNSPLKIDKNFAFFKFDDYRNTVSQADIYFTISTILNNLRTTDDKEIKIIQEEYIRSIIEPENFNRYDDGIIQASILRSSKKEELNYLLDYDSNNKIVIILSKMIENHKDKIIGEGLIEFLFAIAINKLKMNISDLKTIVKKLEHLDNVVFKLFTFYIKKNILK